MLEIARMIRVLLLLLAVLTVAAPAQSPHINCLAADQLTQWPTGQGSSSGPRSVPPLGTLVRLLAGTYDLDLVTTEGVATPTVSRWRIIVVPADATLWPSQFALQRWRPLFVGTRIDVQRPTPLDSLRRGRFLGGLSDFQMGVDTASGRLHWHTHPGAMDSGWSFAVAEVDSSGFWGRWVDGGIAMAMLQRSNLIVGEQQRGYYCAKRVR